MRGILTKEKILTFREYLELMPTDLKDITISIDKKIDWFLVYLKMHLISFPLQNKFKWKMSNPRNNLNVSRSKNANWLSKSTNNQIFEEKYKDLNSRYKYLIRRTKHLTIIFIIWAHYSMLKSMLVTKKILQLTQNQRDQFINEDSNNEYLATKVRNF